MKLLREEGISGKNMPMLLLFAVGVIEFLFITLESLFSGIGYYLAETYVIVPCLLMLGWVLREKLTGFARRRLLLAVAAVSWFVITQCVHKLWGMENHPMATVFLVYLMGFPFAALSEDRENRGLRLMGSVFVAAALVLVCYTGLLLLDRVPESMAKALFWDGARLNALWHPNIVASYMMVGIGFSLMFCVQARKRITQVLLLGAIVLQLAVMALTNCRTTLLLTGALLGGTLFFLIFKGGWKRFVLGLVMAAVVLAGTFKVSGMLFQWNNDRLLASFAASMEHDVPAAETESPEAAPVMEVSEEIIDVFAVEASAAEVQAEEIPETQAPVQTPVIMEETGIIQGDNEQRSLMEDLWSFNGRTQIWEATLKAVRNSKPLMLFGTEYSGTMISIYHWFEVIHAHNSWLETLMRMGIPGLVMALVFTVLAVWSAAKLLLSPGTVLWKKIVAMLAMCVMATGFLEPYLFITNVYYHVADFLFFFLTGYLDYWSNRKPEQEH